MPGGTFLGGMRNAALNFNGNTYVELPNNEAIRARDFTFAAWVYWRGGEAWQRVFDFGRDKGHYIFFTPSTDERRMRFQVRNGGPEIFVEINESFPINRWVHLAVTLDGNTGRIYIDGVLRAEGNMPVDPKDVAQRNWLGKSQYGSDPLFDGMLDEVYIMHRALSAEEVNAMA
ncbi:MAG: LamG domain-containing protein, partial [Planctomycetota bacterium]